jgi:hypothetical protein
VHSEAEDVREVDLGESERFLLRRGMDGLGIDVPRRCPSPICFAQVRRLAEAPDAGSPLTRIE